MPKRWIVSDDSVTTESLSVRHRVLQARADVTIVENIVLANVSRKHPAHAHSALQWSLARIKSNGFDTASGLFEEVS